jgi:hypothetical protein
MAIVGSCPQTNTDEYSEYAQKKVWSVVEDKKNMG